MNKKITYILLFLFTVIQVSSFAFSATGNDHDLDKNTSVEPFIYEFQPFFYHGKSHPNQYKNENIILDQGQDLIIRVDSISYLSLCSYYYFYDSGPVHSDALGELRMYDSSYIPSWNLLKLSSVKVYRTKNIGDWENKLIHWDHNKCLALLDKPNPILENLSDSIDLRWENKPDPKKSGTHVTWNFTYWFEGAYHNKQFTINLK